MKMIKKWINTMHGYAIGPGLGRNEFLGDYIREILTDTDDNKQITIIDADGLWHVMNNESLYKFIVTRKNVILTPNIGEFDRLWEKFMSGKGFFYIY